MILTHAHFPVKQFTQIYTKINVKTVKYENVPKISSSWIHSGSDSWNEPKLISEKNLYTKIN